MDGPKDKVSNRVNIYWLSNIKWEVDKYKNINSRNLYLHIYYIGIYSSMPFLAWLSDQKTKDL